LSGGIFALQKNAAAAEIPTKAIHVRCRHVRADGTDTAPLEQLPDLGRSLTGRQSGQAAPQARNYHWIAAWQVLATSCTNLNI